MGRAENGNIGFLEGGSARRKAVRDAHHLTIQSMTKKLIFTQCALGTSARRPSRDWADVDSLGLCLVSIPTYSPEEKEGIMD